jgi:two-component system, OmpR family, KDP operon response regulator KdpE
MSDRRVLVIDAQPHERLRLHDGLAAYGYTILLAATAQEGYHFVTRQPPMSVLCDSRFPDSDGVELCRQIRRQSRVPILILSAEETEARKIAFLDAGANDYVPKSCGLGEIAARIRASTRHHPASPRPAPVRLGEVVIDVEQQLVWRGSTLLTITKTEWQILALLAERPGAVVPRDRFYATMWAGDAILGRNPLYVSQPIAQKAGCPCRHRLGDCDPPWYGL